MKIDYWIYFEKPGEKDKLWQIMHSYPEEYKQLEMIQAEFGLDVLEASRVIETFKKHIEK